MFAVSVSWEPSRADMLSVSDWEFMNDTNYTFKIYELKCSNNKDSMVHTNTKKISIINNSLSTELYSESLSGEYNTWSFVWALYVI